MDRDGEYPAEGYTTDFGDDQSLLNPPQQEASSARANLPSFGNSSLADSPRATFGRRGSERGVAAVETAIMLPLLFFLFFGIVEFGFYWMADHSVNESARAGARIGATLARETDYQDDIVAAVEKVVRDSVPSGTIDQLTIYKADPDTGLPFAATGTITTCSTDCFRYTWNEAAKTFTLDVSTGWPPEDQAACGKVGHNDYLGVYVGATYASVTGVFPNGRNVAESSVMRLEPVPLSNSCEPAP